MAEFKLTGKAKLIILTAILASLLEIIDTSIVNVAIPTMMGNLGATLEDISWVVTGYIIANAIVLPIAGWLGMQIGRRRYYVGCILLFTFTSVLCGIAPNLSTLIVFRIFQGLAGGALLPTSQALIQEQFPREKAGTASAIYGMGVILGPTLGPTLGGYLTDNLGWRSIFNINLPLGLLAAFLAFACVGDIQTPAPAAAVAATPTPGPAPQKRQRAPVDLFGLLLLCAGVGCLQYVLERGEAEDWFSSWYIRIPAFVAAVSIPTFIWWETLKAKHPILDLRLFKHNAVRNGTAMMATLGMMLYSLIFLIPVFLSSLLGYTATEIGVLFIPGALCTGVMMPIIGNLLRRHDPRLLILIGVAFVEVALFMMTDFSTDAGAKEFFIPLMVRGVGMGFLFVPINALVLGQFSGAQLGQVSGLLNLFRQLGGSAGIAILSTLLHSKNAQNYADLVPHFSALNPPAWIAYQQTLKTLASKPSEWIGVGSQSVAATKVLVGRLQRQILVMSFNQLMHLMYYAFALMLIPLSMVKVTKRFTAGPIDAH